MLSAAANLLGAFIGLGLWGLYSGLFFMTLWAVHRQGTDRICSPVIISIICIYLLNVVSTVTTMIGAHRSFIGPSMTEAFGYLASAEGGVLSTIDDAVLVLCTLVADVAMIWRLNIVWMRDIRIIVLPIFGLAATTSAGLAVITYDVLMTRELPAIARPEYAAGFRAWSAVVLCLTLVSNWLITGLIVGRLWWANKRIKSHYKSDCAPTREYSRIITVLIESGALYSVTVAVFLAAWVCRNQTILSLLSFSLPRVIGIVPTAVVLQRSFGYIQPCDAKEFAHPPPSRLDFALQSSQATRTEVPPPASDTCGGCEPEFPCRPYSPRDEDLERKSIKRSASGLLGGKRERRKSSPALEIAIQYTIERD